MTIKIRTSAAQNDTVPSARGEAQSDGAQDGGEALLAFAAEEEIAETPLRSAPQHSNTTARSLHLHWSSALGMVLIFVLAIVGTYLLVQAAWMPLQANAPRPASLTIETRPSGAELLVDGAAHGNTPATFVIAAGHHRVLLRRGAEERTLDIDVASGAEVAHHIELAPPAPAPAKTGSISVVTDPPGAHVRLDGQLRGVTPLTVSDLAPADHKVSVTTDAGSAERTVTIEAGATASVMFSMAKPSGPAAGWLTIAAPFEISVREGDAQMRAGKASKVILAAGRHELVLANEALGYEEKRTVDVVAGKTTTVLVDAPKRTINANARPWADVTIDGASVGQTPIANLPLAIGAHEIVFRHPQFGERRQSVVVTMAGPNRTAVDMTKP